MGELDEVSVLFQIFGEPRLAWRRNRQRFFRRSRSNTAQIISGMRTNKIRQNKTACISEGNPAEIVDMVRSLLPNGARRHFTRSADGVFIRSNEPSYLQNAAA